MTHPMTVAFRGMRHSKSLDADIRARAAKFEVRCRRITSCHVVVEVAQRRHAQGSRFRISIDMAVPDEEITATREGIRADLRRVIGEAFGAARRRLEDYAQMRRPVAACARPALG